MARWGNDQSKTVGKFMIALVLERFQAFLHPLNGDVRLQAFWVPVASDDSDNPPVVGDLQQQLSRSYPSLISANQAALDFPEFPALALKFQTEPFTAIAELLEALREAQALEEAEAQAQLALNRPQEPPHEGAP